MPRCQHLATIARQLLYSNHILHFGLFFLPVHATAPAAYFCITVSPKYCPLYIPFMVHTFDLSSPKYLYFDLVSASHEVHTLCVSQSHLQLRRTAHSWTLDTCIEEATEKAECNGLVSQANLTHETSYSNSHTHYRVFTGLPHHSTFVILGPHLDNICRHPI